MRIGLWGGDVAGVKPLDHLVDDVVAAEAEGFHSYWMPAISGHDPLIALALAAARTSRIELGTAVVPTYAHHPFSLAQTAMSLQVASGGRFVLGIGPSHQRVVEGRFGLSYERPVANTRDALEIISRLAGGGQVRFEGDEWSVDGYLMHPELAAFPVLVSALGPQMLRLAGRLAAGTFTWMTGPVTLREHTVPSLCAAATEHHRNPTRMRIVAGAPVAVCDASHADAVRHQGGELFARYGMLPAYRAMLDREGWATPASALVIGDEDAVRAELERYAEAGVTDFGAVQFATDPDTSARTRALLAELAAG